MCPEISVNLYMQNVYKYHLTLVWSRKKIKYHNYIFSNTASFCLCHKGGWHKKMSFAEIECERIVFKRLSILRLAYYVIFSYTYIVIAWIMEQITQASAK